MKKWRFVLRGVILAGLLAGCSAQSNKAELATEMAAADYYADSVTDYAYEEEVLASPELSKEMAAAGSELQTTARPNLPVGRKMITELNLTIETVAMDQAVATISNAVQTLGGYLQSSSISGRSVNYNGELRYASLVARVPQDKLTDFLTAIEGSGNIRHKFENITDVTLQYTDTEDRITTLKIEQERLWELLAKAESIESIIALEQRLSDIRYELQSYQSQLKTYDNQVDYATVYLELNEVIVYTPQAADGAGQRMINGLKTNWHFVTQSSLDLLVFLVSHIPVFAVLGVLGTVGFVLIKRKSGKKSPQKGAPSSDLDQKE